jgi:hypothetical protein
VPVVSLPTSCWVLLLLLLRRISLYRTHLSGRPQPPEGTWPRPAAANAAAAVSAGVAGHVTNANS